MAANAEEGNDHIFDDLMLDSVNQKHAKCKRKARERIQVTKRISQEIATLAVNSVTKDDLGKREAVEELSGKRGFLKDGLSYETGQETEESSLVEGGHVVAEYEALANHVLRLMKQAEDEANRKGTEDDGKYDTEPGLAGFIESIETAVKTICMATSRRATTQSRREIAFDFSDLLEVTEREKQSLDKLMVHHRSCLALIDKLKEAKTIGKLQADKLAAIANNIDRSCDAFLSLTN